MNRIARSAWVVLIAAAGCTGLTPRQGFDEVADSASKRGGLRLHWNTGTEADAEVQAAVASMLARELTADDAVQIALLNNRELQATYEELNLAQADVVQAGLLQNPVFSGEIRFATSGDGSALVLDVAQDFVSLLMMPMRKARAQAEFEAAKLRITTEVFDAAYAVRLAFLDYQATEQKREMRTMVLEAASASYDLAKRLREAGNIRDLDVFNERALMEQARIDLARAENHAGQERERLNALMGLWGNQTRWKASKRLPPPDDGFDGESLEQRALEASLDLSLLRKEIEIEARAMGIAKPMGWLGEAEIGAAGERETDGAWTVGPSLALPIPLFDQGQAVIGSAQARLRQAEERYYARAVQIRSRVRAAFENLTFARDRARYELEIILPLRQEIVDQTQVQYNAMQVSAFQLLLARRDQITAGGEYIESLRDYWKARATLEQILRGRMTPFEGGDVRSPGSSESSHRESRSDGGHP